MIDIDKLLKGKCVTVTFDEPKYTDNIQIGCNTNIKNSVISSGVVVVGNNVTINGTKLPPCPTKRKVHSSTVINNNIYIDGYEFVDGKWRKTLRALWHRWF